MGESTGVSASRWLPRFRLRTFLAFVTVLCLLLGWRIWAIERIERPIRELERLGWQVSYYSEIIAFFNPGGPVFKDVPARSYWQKLFLGHRRFDLPDSVTFPTRDERPNRSGFHELLEASVISINRLPAINEVDLSGTDISQHDVATLAQLQHVRNLWLDDTSLGDAALAQLMALQRLEKLSLWDTNLSAEALLELSRALPNCEIQHDSMP